MIERSKDELIEWLFHQIDFDENDPYGTGGGQSEYLWQILAIIYEPRMVDLPRKSNVIDEEE